MSNLTLIEHIHFYLWYLFSFGIYVYTYHSMFFQIMIPSGSIVIEEQHFFSIYKTLSSLPPSIVKAETWIYWSCVQAWSLWWTWKRGTVGIKHSYRLYYCSIAYCILVLYPCGIGHTKHFYYSVFYKHTIFVLGHQKFATDKPLAPWAWG